MKHIVENLGDGRILVKDITPLEEYDSIGVSLTSDISNISFKIGKYDSEDIISFTMHPDKVVYLRDNSGYILNTGEFFEDYIYETKLSYETINHGIMESVQNSLFMKNLIKKIIHLNKKTSWKEYFGYYSTNIKTPLRRLSWLYDVRFSFQAGLYAESMRILKSLEKIC